MRSTANFPLKREAATNAIGELFLKPTITVTYAVDAAIGVIAEVVEVEVVVETTTTFITTSSASASTMIVSKSR